MLKKPKCKISYCDNEIYGKQPYCSRHYKQMKYKGKIGRTHNDENEYILKNKTAIGYIYKKGGGKRKEKFIIDIDDLPKVRKYHWHLNKVNATLKYISCSKIGALQRFLLGAEKKEIVDHINGNTLDNRKSNLRICTHKQNTRNSKLSKNNKTGFTGVCCYSYDKSKYESYIHVNNTKIGLGIHFCVKEAAKNYNKAALEYFGEFARLNKI